MPSRAGGTAGPVETPLSAAAAICATKRSSAAFAAASAAVAAGRLTALYTKEACTRGPGQPSGAVGPGEGLGLPGPTPGLGLGLPGGGGHDEPLVVQPPVLLKSGGRPSHSGAKATQGSGPVRPGIVGHTSGSLPVTVVYTRSVTEVGVCGRAGGAGVRGAHGAAGSAAVCVRLTAWGRL